ncbi:Uncharacterised protein [Vibrio cholerae]|nr:Uncharacterised protein [Vibrio cholerae]CSI92355.1 Uncharacterised protein [Vibrio cholerae]
MPPSAEASPWAAPNLALVVAIPPSMAAKERSLRAFLSSRKQPAIIARLKRRNPSSQIISVRGLGSPHT